MQGPDNLPLLVLDRKGEGRVGMLLSDQGWLWARGFEGGGPHVSLYRRIAHWLMKEPELEEERLTAAGRGMTLDINRPDHERRSRSGRGHHAVGQALTVPTRQSEPGVFTGSAEGTRSASTRSAMATSPRLPCRPGQRARVRRTRSRPRDVSEPVAAATGGSVRRLGTTLTGNVSLPNIVPVRSGERVR
jgi:hypothetical protein